jgi:hypothetical protein
LSPDENIEKSLSSIMLNGKTLLDLIESFEKLSIMEPLWVRRRMPEILRDYESLARWIEVFKFAQENRTEAILHEQVRDIRNKLESQVSKIRTWTHDYRVILRAGRSKAERFANKIEDPMRDLGLVRWDYDLSEEEKNEVVETLENLTSGDESDLNDTAPLVATKMEIARVDTKACQIMCAVLWALNRFREIVSLVDECRANSLQRFPATLTIIQGAAQMKMGGIPSRMDRRLVVERSLKLMGDMPKTKKKGILLGVGYILYHAWKQEMVGKSVRERQLMNQPQEVREWADKSFEVGEEAYQSFEQNTLPWAYAVNHCAYVGIVTGVKPQKTVEYLQILFRLKGYSAIWSPRFDDTIGCYYLVRAENAWGTSNEIDKRKLDLKEDLDNARRYLEEAAKNDPGDIDIDEHLGRLDVISNEYFSQKNRAKDS